MVKYQEQRNRVSNQGRSIAYCQFLQQRQQLVVHDGVLWRYYAQPQEEQSWLQLVVPRELEFLEFLEPSG